MEEMEIVQPDKLKDALIAKTAMKTMTSDKIVEKIISFQFEDLRSSMTKGSLLRVAMLGTFKLTPHRVERRMISLMNRYKDYERVIAAPGMSERVKENARAKLEALDKQVKILEEVYEVRC